MRPPEAVGWARKVYIMAPSAVKTDARREGRRTARCVVILALLAALPLAPALLGRKVLLPADLLMVMQPFKAHAAEMGFHRVSNPILDAVQQFWPWRSFAGEQLRRGVLPLWNPYMLSGTPFVGNDQSAIYYPETWLFAIMRPERAFAWAAFVSLFVSGGFMLLFLRGQGLRRRAGMVGATAWMYNGFVVGWICLPTIRSVPAWLPLMLAAYDRALAARGRARAGWTALTALAVGLQFLAGNLHASFFVLLVFAAYVVWATVREGRYGRGIAAPLGFGAAALGLGFLLAAVQLLPALEFGFRSSRVAATYGLMMSYRLPWSYLLAGLMPDLFGNPVDYNHWGAALGAQYRAYTETAWYTGAATIVLAAFALLRPLRRRTWLWAGLIVLAFALALGSPLNYLFFALVPGFRQLPGINRALLLVCFAVPALAAYGVQRGLAATPDEREAVARALIRVCTASMVVAVAGALWAWTASGAFETPAVELGPYIWLQLARFLVLSIAVVGFVVVGIRRARPSWYAIAIALLAVDVAGFAHHFYPLVPARYTEPRAAVVTWLQGQSRAADAAGQPFRILSLGANALDRMAPNVPMLFRLADVQGSDSITYGRYARLLGAISRTADGFPQPDPGRAAALLGARYVVTALDLSNNSALRRMEEPGFECDVYEATPAAAPFAERAAPLRLASSDAEALAALVGEAGTGWPMATVVVRDRLPAKVLGALPRLGEGSWSSEVLPARYLGPNHVAMEAPRSAGLHGPVLLRQTCYPGWQAYADGRPTVLTAADYCLQFLPDVPAGTRRLDLVFEPTSSKLGAFAALAAMALLVALGAFAWRPGRGSA
jgi:hypothetical protein